jgi:hypothetical protein
MPSWKQLSDADIAAVITYTRNSWGNKLRRSGPTCADRRRAQGSNDERNSTRPPPAHAADHHDDHGHHPTGLMRWVTTTNHKDIGTLYLLFSLTMFFVGGCALTIRAELFQPGLQIVIRILQLADHAARSHHDFRRDHAGGRGIRQLAGAADDRRAGHGLRAMNNWSFWLLAGGADAGRIVLRPGGARPAAGRYIRRCRCRRAWAWT